MNAIKGKIIVVTGGTAGVGKAVAEMLQKNNTVIVLSSSAPNNGATSFACDVSDKQRVQEVFDTIGKLYGHIDILLNNAGYGISGATEDAVGLSIAFQGTGELALNANAS